jgi:hypothetical protein
MSKRVNAVVAVILWTLMILFSQVVVYSVMCLFFTPPEWADDLTFFIIAGIYTYIIVRYSVRIDISIQGKRIFYYRSRGKK